MNLSLVAVVAIALVVLLVGFCAGFWCGAFDSRMRHWRREIDRLGLKRSAEESERG